MNELSMVRKVREAWIKHSLMIEMSGGYGGMTVEDVEVARRAFMKKALEDLFPLVVVEAPVEAVEEPVRENLDSGGHEELPLTGTLVQLFEYSPFCGVPHGYRRLHGEEVIPHGSFFVGDDRYWYKCLTLVGEKVVESGVDCVVCVDEGPPEVFELEERGWCWTHHYEEQIPAGSWLRMLCDGGGGSKWYLVPNRCLGMTFGEFEKRFGLKVVTRKNNV